MRRFFSFSVLILKEQKVRDLKLRQLPYTHLIPRWHRRRCRFVPLLLHRFRHFVRVDEIVDEFSGFPVLQLALRDASLRQERPQRLILARQVKTTLRIPPDVRHMLEVRRRSNIRFRQLLHSIAFLLFGATEDGLLLLIWWLDLWRGEFR
jgi:hypothetical protein